MTPKLEMEVKTVLTFILLNLGQNFTQKQYEALAFSTLGKLSGDTQRDYPVWAYIWKHRLLNLRDPDFHSSDGCITDAGMKFLGDDHVGKSR